MKKKDSSICNIENYSQKELLQWWITTPRIKKSRIFVWSKQNEAFEFIVAPGCSGNVYVQKR